MDRLGPVRIARFTAGDDPAYGVVGGDLDQFGQPAEDAVVVELSGDPLYAGIQPTQTEHRLSDVRLLAPVIPRSKVVAIGRNYRAHAAELGNDVPEEPLMFLKPNTSVVGPGDQVFYPTQSERLDYEGELAVVIGRICRDVPPEQATDVIFGYTIANDVTVRDFVRNFYRPPVRAKGWDTLCPLGPYLVEGEIADPHQLELRAYVNGELRQRGNTQQLLRGVPELIEFITGFMTLEPGDILLTGTPRGVSHVYPGDVMRLEIDGIGALENAIIAESPGV